MGSDGDQSNFGDETVLKFYRRVEAGANAYAQLTFPKPRSAPVQHTLPLLGALEYRAESGDAFTSARCTATCKIRLVAGSCPRRGLLFRETMAEPIDVSSAETSASHSICNFRRATLPRSSRIGWEAFWSGQLPGAGAGDGYLLWCPILQISALRPSHSRNFINARCYQCSTTNLLQTFQQLRRRLNSLAQNPAPLRGKHRMTRSTC